MSFWPSGLKDDVVETGIVRNLSDSDHLGLWQFSEAGQMNPRIEDDEKTSFAGASLARADRYWGVGTVADKCRSTLRTTKAQVDSLEPFLDWNPQVLTCQSGFASKK
jgi:hypothetical protein